MSMWGAKGKVDNEWIQEEAGLTSKAATYEDEQNQAFVEQSPGLHVVSCKQLSQLLSFTTHTQKHGQSAHCSADCDPQHDQIVKIITISDKIYF